MLSLFIVDDFFVSFLDQLKDNSFYSAILFNSNYVTIMYNFKFKKFFLCVFKQGLPRSTFMSSYQDHK